jgi:hypothetical protein
MKMHGGGQTKTVPISRIIHEAVKRIYPLTQGHVNVHWAGDQTFIILRAPIQAALK